MLIKTEIVSCHTADSKPVKQEVNGTVILPPLVFPGRTLACHLEVKGSNTAPAGHQGANSRKVYLATRPKVEDSTAKAEVKGSNIATILHQYKTL